MKNLRTFEIPFVGLKQGTHQFEHHVDDAFFETFEYAEFNSADLQVTTMLEKKSTLLEFGFQVSGTVNVNCDLTNEPFDLPIEGSLKLIVKFGEEFNDENDEILIIPHGEHKVQVAQYIYEMIVLSTPTKRVHPGIADGTLKSELLEKLEELQPKEVQDDTEETDPRWDTLKKLLTDK
ncbi:YceD family protein [Sungkyunkwania multivorans]|uniref:YceD family protein n=1 Tax=Sungkyunkwania multivorans TaxID=1173618 RepID=A0ABW3D1M6_9FLAO